MLENVRRKLFSVTYGGLFAAFVGSVFPTEPHYVGLIYAPELFIIKVCAKVSILNIYYHQ